MKQVLCYACDLNMNSVWGFNKTLFHGRGTCLACRKTKTGFIMQARTLEDQFRERLSENRGENDKGEAYCPHCDEELSYLRYYRRGVEYGSADLEGDLTETDDFADDNGENITYCCPHCDEDLTIEEIVYTKDEELAKLQTDIRPLTE